jgi:hypothetical protein
MQLRNTELCGTCNALAAPRDVVLSAIGDCVWQCEFDAISCLNLGAFLTLSYSAGDWTLSYHGTNGELIAEWSSSNFWSCGDVFMLDILSYNVNICGNWAQQVTISSCRPAISQPTCCGGKVPPASVTITFSAAPPGIGAPCSNCTSINDPGNNYVLTLKPGTCDYYGNGPPVCDTLTSLVLQDDGNGYYTLSLTPDSFAGFMVYYLAKWNGSWCVEGTATFNLVYQSFNECDWTGVSTTITP